MNVARALRGSVVSIAFMIAVGGCAAEPGDGDADSVSSGLATPTIVCLVPVDVDGDGVGDVMRASNTVVTDVRSCEQRYNGAVTLSPDMRGPRVRAFSPTLAPKATTPGGGGPTYTAGDGMPGPVASAVAARNLHNTERYRDGYNCQQFSRDLERFLQDEGFHATFTVINSGVGRQRYGHAIVDVHIDGVAWWIEPQTGLPFELDEDGDGDVETGPRGGLGPNTEGNTSIEVFENYEEFKATYPHL